MGAELSGRHVAPSILAADFARLGSQVQDVLDAGARIIHVDVMDGHFVPPITFGPNVVAALAERIHGSGALIDVHLMIERPERQLATFISAGADSITIHVEATPHVHYALQAVREGGCSAGVALSPATPGSVLADVAADGMLDLALCMSVNPGWGNQTLIGNSYAKLAAMRAALPALVALEVDGGINLETARRVARAGANLLVAGSAVFGAAEPGAAWQELTRSAWPAAQS
ncbi:MAG: ribulose-phosphate 3-epimerase [Solirubrobacteraceae bacterium]